MHKMWCGYAARFQSSVVYTYQQNSINERGGHPHGNVYSAQTDTGHQGIREKRAIVVSRRAYSSERGLRNGSIIIRFCFSHIMMRWAVQQVNHRPNGK